MTLLASDQAALLLGLGLAALLFYAAILRRESRQVAQLPAGATLLLWCFRGTVAALALVALSRPAREVVETQTRPPVVPVLVDESLSMSFPEDRRNPLVRQIESDADPQVPRPTRYLAAGAAARRVQEALRGSHRVPVHVFSDVVSLLKDFPAEPRAEGEPAAPGQRISQKDLFAAHPRPTGHDSHVADALLDATRGLTEERVSGVVLITDGRRTGGAELGEAAQRLAEAKLPVHTIALGTEHPLPDLRIDEVSAPAEASHGDVLTFHVRVGNQIASSLKTELLVEEKDADDPQAAYVPIVRRTLELSRGDHTVQAATIPETEGLRRFRFSLPEQADEIDVRNNVAEVTVRVVKRTLRVLLIAGQPSREYFYVVPALLRDPVVELSCFLQSADIDYVQQGNATVEKLPETVKDWSRYDVAVLFDVDPNGITSQQLAGLEAMVADGGGLFVVGGRTHGLAKLVQVHAARIRGLLPTDVDKNRPLDHDRLYDRPFRAKRTTVGRAHPILLSSSDRTVDAQTWAVFEKLDFYWSHPLGTPKPKTVVLLERSEAEAGDSALLAVHRYQDGAVGCCALDALWAWRHPHESWDYDRFFVRIVRYLGESRLLGTQQQAALTTDRRSYAPGEEVRIELRLLDPALMVQLAGQPLFVSATGPDGEPYMVPLSPDVRGEPAYRGTYRARRTGTTTIAAKQAAPDADSEAKPLFDVKHAFEVRLQSLEDVDTRADLDGLKEIAERTGGLALDYRSLDRFDELIAAIPTDPLVLTHVSTVEVWDRLWLVVLFAVLAGGELAFRKWWGLL